MKIVYLLFTLLIITSCNSQEIKIEEQLQECTYASFEDNGMSLKKSIHQYESYLIRQKVLESRNGESYLKALKNIHEIKIDSVFTSFFDYSIHKPDSDKFLECSTNIMNSDLFKQSKLYKIQQAIIALEQKGNINGTNITNKLLSIYDASDYELSYNKLAFFTTLETINYVDDSAIMRKLPQLEDKSNYTEIDTTNSFTIYLNKDSSVTVNNSNLTTEDLKKRLKKYYLDNTKNSLIELKANRAAKYSKYVEVSNLIQSVLNQLRNELSIKTYNKTFDELESKEKQEIKNTYPLKIKEGE